MQTVWTLQIGQDFFHLFDEQELSSFLQAFDKQMMLILLYKDIMPHKTVRILSKYIVLCIFFCFYPSVFFSVYAVALCCSWDKEFINL